MLGCNTISKRFLIGLNTLSAWIGVGAIVAGIVVKLKLFGFIEQMPMGSFEKAVDFAKTTPTLLISLGAFIMVVSFCGCFGAGCESVFLLKIYKVVLFLLILSLGVIAGLIFAKQDAMRYTMDRALQAIFKGYTLSSELPDMIQVQFSCCGVYSSQEWTKKEEWISMAERRAVDEEYPLGDHPVPDSCCIDMRSGCGLAHTNNVTIKIHSSGCSEDLWIALSTNVDVIGIVGLALATVLMACVVFACTLISFVDDPHKAYK